MSPAVVALRPRRPGLRGGALAATTLAALVLPAAAVAALQYLAVLPVVMAVAAGVAAAAPLVVAEVRLRARARQLLRVARHEHVASFIVSTAGTVMFRVAATAS